MNYQQVKLTSAQMERAQRFASGYQNEATSSAYLTDVSQFIHWLENEQKVELVKLTDAGAQKQLDLYSKRLGEVLTIQSRIRKTNVARYWLKSQGLTVSKPSIDGPDPKLSWVNPDTADLLLASERLTLRSRLVIALLALEGFTPSEVVNLMVNGEPLEFQALRTHGIYQEYLKERGCNYGPVFYSTSRRNRLSRSWVWCEVRRAAARLGLVGVNPIGLRVGLAVRLRDGGASAERISDLMEIDIQNVRKMLRRARI